MFIVMAVAADALVAVVGSTNQDLICTGPKLPVPGETVTHDSFLTCFGGKGANQAVQASLLGADVSMVARIGKDDFGTAMLANFDSCGVNREHVTVADAPTGCALITVAEGTNTIVIVPGANALLGPDDVPDIQAKVLLCQLEVPVATSLAAFKKCGGFKVLNTAPIPAEGVPQELLQAADCVCANEVELGLMTGIDASTVDGAIKAAKKLDTLVLATLGGNGALLVNKDCSVHVPALPAKALDTSGAGDSFLGAFAAFVASGYSLLTATALANHVAAYSVQRPGTQPSYPKRQDLDLPDYDLPWPLSGNYRLDTTLVEV